MKKKYKNWIKKYASSNVDGLCKEYALLMKVTFPELTLVDGEFQQEGELFTDGHYWLKDGEEIVDPTFSQFGPGEYSDVYEETYPELNPEILRAAIVLTDLVCEEPLLPCNIDAARFLGMILDDCSSERG